jgi:hypothetical protein
MTVTGHRRGPFVLFLLAVLVCLAILFDRTWRHGEVFSPADVLFTTFPWAYDTSRPIPSNLTRTDEVNYHQPLMATHWARLRSGDFPEWDPSVLGGVPAFLQGLNTGMAFSPLSLPFYLTTPENAVTIYAPLRLLLAAVFMWWWLRARGHTATAAATGAIAYGFNGAFLVWLSAPMPTVALWLPLILLGIDRAVARAHPRDAALVAFAVGMMLLGAYLPTSLVVTATSGAYAAQALLAARRSDERVAWHPAALLAGAAAGGLALAAVGLVPMLESLSTSPAAARDVAGSTLPWQNLATFALPDFWGTPRSQTWWFPGPGNYPEFVTYLGIATLALAGAGVATAWRTRDVPILVLAGVGLCALLAMYGLPPANWGGHLPGFRQMNPYRWNVALACATAGLAAVGVDGLLGIRRAGSGRPLPASSRSDARWALAGAVVACGLLAAFAGAALWSQIEGIRRFAMQPIEKRQLVRFALIGSASLTAAAGIAWLGARQPRRARTVALVLCGIVGLDLLHFGYGFNPTISRSRLYPPTAGIERARMLTGQGRLAPVAPPAQFADGHAWSMFGLRTVTGFDFRGDASYQRFLARAAGSAPRPARWDYVGLADASKLNLRLLGLLGVTVVATPPLSSAASGAGYATIGEMTSGRTVVQELHVPEEGFRAVDVLTATYGRGNRGTLTLALRDPEDDRQVASRTVAAADVPNTAWLRLEFPPQPRRAGPWRLEISAAEAGPGEAVTLWTTAGRATSAGALSVDGRRDERAVWFRTFADAGDRVPGAELIWSGDLNLYANPQARPRAWFVQHVEVLPEPAHLGRLTESSFDSATTALLAVPLAGRGSAARVVAVDEVSDPDHRRIEVDAPEGGILVVSDRYDPGWRAEADGRPIALARADAVLMATAVPPGTRVVTLAFDSPTLVPSAAISTIALGGIALAALIRRRRPGTGGA